MLISEKIHELAVTLDETVDDIYNLENSKAIIVTPSFVTVDVETQTNFNSDQSNVVWSIDNADSSQLGSIDVNGLYTAPKLDFDKQLIVRASKSGLPEVSGIAVVLVKAVEIPTYNLSVSPSIVNEGEIVTFTLQTKGVKANSVIPYIISGVSLFDLEVSSLSGNFTLDSEGKASLNVKIKNDLSTEGDETLTLSLVNGKASIDVLIKDTSVTPPVEPTRIKVLGPNVLNNPRGGANNYDNGIPDYIDISNLPKSVAWDLYLGPNQTLAPSRNGVESSNWQRWHLFGHTTGLYQPLPRIGEDNKNILQYYPNGGNDPQFAVSWVKNRPEFLRDGARGYSIASPYTTWHGHTRKEGDVVHTSPHIPMWVGITLHGHILYAMRDGSMKTAGIVPVESYANDFTFFEPDRKVFFYCDTAKGKVMKVDRNVTPWAITTHAEGFRSVDSLRAVGENIYIADKAAGEIWEINGFTSAKRLVCRLPFVFWIDYFSDGDLCVMTQQRHVRRINRITGEIGPNIVPAHADRNLQVWVTVDVDRNGTMGEKDAFILLSVVGEANVDFYRYTKNGVYKTPEHGKGGWPCGPVMYIGDTWGHYPWVGAHHPDDAALLVQGMSNAIPQMVVALDPSRVWQGMPNPDNYAGWLVKGRQIALYGDTVSRPIDSRYTTFMPQFTNGGGLISADHFAEMEPSQFVQFLRQGGFGIQARDFNKDAIKGCVYQYIPGSVKFLKEGYPLVKKFLDYVDKNL